MKKLILFVVFVAFSVSCFAQQNYQDVVRLKNGSIIRGVIVEQVPNQSIKVETSDKNVFVYKMDEIEKITKELINTVNGGQKNYGPLEKRFIGLLDVGYSFGVGDFKEDRIALNFVGGYKVNPFFISGIGLGLRHYYDSEALALPIFAHLQANFLNRDVTPFVAARTGYTFDLSNDFEGLGMLFNPSLGVEYKSSRKTRSYFSVGYEMQQMKVYWWGLGYNHPFTHTTKEYFGALTINVGLSF